MHVREQVLPAGGAGVRNAAEEAILAVLGVSRERGGIRGRAGLEEAVAPGAVRIPGFGKVLGRVASGAGLPLDGGFQTGRIAPITLVAETDGKINPLAFVHREALGKRRRVGKPLEIQPTVEKRPALMKHMHVRGRGRRGHTGERCLHRAGAGLRGRPAHDTEFTTCARMQTHPVRRPGKAEGCLDGLGLRVKHDPGFVSVGTVPEVDLGEWAAATRRQAVVAAGVQEDQAGIVERAH